MIQMKIQTLAYVLVGLLALGFIWIYNRIISLKKRAEGAWSDIDVQLKRRHDLIPSLVTCVQGYIQHERGTLTEVTALRQTAQATRGIEERGKTEMSLGRQLKSLILLTERYPDLKANTTFLDLQRRLTETEDLIQYARRYYNAVVRDFNTLTGQFPNLLVAKITKFMPLEFFQLENDDEAEVQKVSL
jgi:LemA protein